MTLILSIGKPHDPSGGHARRAVRFAGVGRRFGARRQDVTTASARCRVLKKKKKRRGKIKEAKKSSAKNSAGLLNKFAQLYSLDSLHVWLRVFGLSTTWSLPSLEC